MRRSTDHLQVTPLTPGERQALRIIEERPGITVAELAEELRGRDEEDLANPWAAATSARGLWRDG